MADCPNLGSQAHNRHTLAALELLTISIPAMSGAIILAGRDFTLTEDEEDWLPPFTPDAE
jgi:hypothetical protein